MSFAVNPKYEFRIVRTLEKVIFGIGYPHEYQIMDAVEIPPLEQLIRASAGSHHLCKRANESV